jgi:hypothetical protein
MNVDESCTRSIPQDPNILVFRRRKSRLLRTRSTLRFLLLLSPRRRLCHELHSKYSLDAE